MDYKFSTTDLGAFMLKKKGTGKRQKSRSPAKTSSPKRRYATATTLAEARAYIQRKRAFRFYLTRLPNSSKRKIRALLYTGAINLTKVSPQHLLILLGLITGAAVVILAIVKGYTVKLVIDRKNDVYVLEFTPPINRSVSVYRKPLSC